VKAPEKVDRPGVRGWLHAPAGVPVAATALTHGAGSNCEAPLLKALAEALAGAGHSVLRYDLPYRQARPHGPPGAPKRDQDGIRLAAAALREAVPNVPLYLAGHSYGGRQSSMVAAEDSSLAAALLLLSYPLHAPG
jgi:predicted alpha/beta-hydrolase family hydrolase